MKAPPTAPPVPQWHSLSECLVLNPDEVHVWKAGLDRTSFQIQSLRNTLAADEQARADRFYFEKDRAHFIVARGVLRTILGRYLNRAPERLSFLYSSYGKPALAGDSDGAAIRFNLSHSDGIALYAITRNREVGIDIERIRFDLAFAEIAQRIFSAREAATLRTLPTEMQPQAFFRYWTRKEAYIKARGEGLSLPLNQFDVSLVPGESNVTLSTPRNPAEVARWSVQELEAVPGYVAAFAVEGHGLRLSCWQWPDQEQHSV